MENNEVNNVEEPKTISPEEIGQAVGTAPVAEPVAPEAPVEQPAVEAAAPVAEAAPVVEPAPAAEAPAATAEGAEAKPKKVSKTFIIIAAAAVVLLAVLAVVYFVVLK